LINEKRKGKYDDKWTWTPPPTTDNNNNSYYYYYTATATRTIHGKYRAR